LYVGCVKNKMATAPPPPSPSPAIDEKRCPTLMEDVYQQVCAHPKYKKLSPQTRDVFEETSMRLGPTVNIPQNNRWAVEMWEHLHLGKQYY